MKYAFTNKAKKYAREIVGGKVPACQLIKLACERFLNDLAREKDKDYPYYFDKDAAEKICKFLELLPHTKGEWAFKKQLIILEPWQVFCFANIFGWKKKKDKKRRFREAYIFVPRKNGKSIIAAGIGLYTFAYDDDFGAEVYCGATTERQAWEVFRPAKQMLQRSPMLTEHKGISVNAKSLSIAEDGARFEPVIAKPGDGASPSCWILDEYHEHDTPDQYDTALTGMGSRKQPLMLIITTAGFNVQGPCYQKGQEAIEMLQGTVPNEELFAALYTVDKPDDWANPESLEMANPNMGISVYRDYLESQQAKAVRDVSFQNTFKTKHLNVWVAARSAFFNLETWKSCEDTDLDIDDFLGQECVIGGDLAGKLDLNAKIRLFWRDIDSKRHYYCISPEFYIPEDTVYYSDNKVISSKYQKWVNMGVLKATQGAEVDFREILEDIKRDNMETPVIITAIDPYGATNLSHQLDDEGLTPVMINQNYTGMSDGMKELQAAIESGRFHHDGHPIMTWCIGNVTGKYIPGSDDVVRPTKENPDSKIDGAVALIMAIGQAMLQGMESKSIYETTEL